MNDAIVVDEATGEVVQELARHGAMLFDKRGLDLKEETDYDEWIEVGASLSQANKKLWWYIGDWWRFGSRKWGERKEAAEAAGLNVQSCKDAAWVAGMFETSRRRDLSWSIHKEVAALPVLEQDRILDAEPTVAQARKAAREYRAAQPTEPMALPVGQYSVIYADPPWQYRDQHLGDGFDAIVPDTHYPTMPTTDICDLPIKDMRADKCVLFMWATFPMLQDGLDVVKAWGFEYKTAFVWHKMRGNLGHYHSASCELLVIGTSGGYAPTWLDSRPEQLIQIKRTGRHSEKPDEIYDVIDLMYPPGETDRIELFRRGSAPRPHWSVWGNQADDV